MRIQIEGFRTGLPPAELIEHAAIREAAIEHANANANAAAARTAVVDLEQRLPLAVEKDRRGYAAALARNPRARDPGEPATTAAKEQIEAASRHAEALRGVEEMKLDALQTALDDHAAEWAQLIAASDAEARADALKLIDQMDSVFTKLTQNRKLSRYLRDAGVERESDARPVMFNASASGGTVAVGRTEIGVHELVEALRRFMDPPRAEAKPTYVGGLRAA
jgi:hypothetical protein